jgi:hypothetical protein
LTKARKATKKPPNLPVLATDIFIHYNDVEEHYEVWKPVEPATLSPFPDLSTAQVAEFVPGAPLQLQAPSKKKLSYNANEEDNVDDCVMQPSVSVSSSHESNESANDDTPSTAEATTQASQASVVSSLQRVDSRVQAPAPLSPVATSSSTATNGSSSGIPCRPSIKFDSSDDGREPVQVIWHQRERSIDTFWCILDGAMLQDHKIDHRAPKQSVFCEPEAMIEWANMLVKDVKAHMVPHQWRIEALPVQQLYIHFSSSQALKASMTANRAWMDGLDTINHASAAEPPSTLTINPKEPAEISNNKRERDNNGNDEDCDAKGTKRAKAATTQPQLPSAVEVEASPTLSAVEPTAPAIESQQSQSPATQAVVEATQSPTPAAPSLISSSSATDDDLSQLLEKHEATKTPAV